MSQGSPLAPVADVKAAQALDRLVIAPRRPQDMRDVTVSLRKALPGITVRRTAEGVSIPPSASPLLWRRSSDLDLNWTEAAREFATNRLAAAAAYDRVRSTINEILSAGRSGAQARLQDVAGLEVLDDHQWVNVAAMTIPGGYGLCLFDEQGAGKTVSLIFAFDVLVERDEADFALIVAPKSMIPEWEYDLGRFKGDLYFVQVATGTRRDKLKALRSEADVIITNYETAVSLERELRALLRRRPKRAILVVDESYHTKNLDARRTQALRRLRESCGRAFVLCGTPAPNAPHDLVQQFNIVDFGLTFDGAVIPEDRDDARPVIQRLIEERGLIVRHLKADVLPGLAAKRFSRVLLPLQPLQEAAYTSALNDFIVHLKSVDDDTFRRQVISFMARRVALLQICSNPTRLVPGYDELPAKLLALDEVLDDAVAQRGEKVVIWSFYTASLEAIVDRYAAYRPVRYDGTVTDVRLRREAIRRFQEDDETMLFVGNPAAAGSGLTLHRARLAVYESMSNQSAHYLQSLDRIHRRGQERDVNYIILLCDGTIEVLEYNRLLQKERAAQELLGDSTAQPATREGFLNEALSLIRMLGHQQ